MKLLSLASAVFIVSAVPALADAPARYSVTFDGTWSAQTHPLEYPSGAHFSGLVGATHNGDFALFAEGATATAGLERLAEAGAHKPLDDEIRAAVRDGKAGALFEGAPIFAPPGRAQAAFEIDARHPMVSLVAMIAPSPDWFAGVANVSLYENDAWIASKTVPLYAWDAGSDDGTTFMAPDADSQPRGRIAPNAAPPFASAGEARPVATVTFTRQ